MSEANAKPKRRWFQFSLRSLLIAVTLVAGLLVAWRAYVEPYRFVGTKAGQAWDGNALKMRFCWCPAGKFTMGSPKNEKDRYDDEDQVSVTLTRGFWLGRIRGDSITVEIRDEDDALEG